MTTLLLAGGSSGSAMHAAVKAAASLEAGQKCVVVFPDSVRNYMSKYLSDKWMRDREFMKDEENESTKHW